MDQVGEKSLDFIQDFSPGGQGRWGTPVGSISMNNAWTHVVVVYNSQSDNNAPILYINGAAKTLTMRQTPRGTRRFDDAYNGRIGNMSDGTRTFDGLIDEVRVTRGP